MRIFFYGQTSFNYWLGALSAPDKSERVSVRALVNCEPTVDSLQHVEHCFAHLPRPYQVSVSTARKRPIDGAVKHLYSRPPAGRCFCRVQSGIYASSPELCFVELARTLSFHELVKAGNALCGCFAIELANGGKLEKREALTNKRRISAFLRANPGITGARAARKALEYVSEGVASPPEAFLVMVLGLPFRYGGYHLAGLKVNERLKPTQKAQAVAGRRTLVPDLLLPDACLAIEYDSTSEHAKATQLTRDAQKRLALEADGYKVITVTTRQLASRREMHHIAEQIYGRCGRRLRPQSGSFDKQQSELFRLGWTLDNS